jgi:hypothetical protein
VEVVDISLRVEVDHAGLVIVKTTPHLSHQLVGNQLGDQKQPHHYGGKANNRVGNFCKESSSGNKSLHQWTAVVVRSAIAHVLNQPVHQRVTKFLPQERCMSDLKVGIINTYFIAQPLFVSEWEVLSKMTMAITAIYSPNEMGRLQTINPVFASRRDVDACSIVHGGRRV